MTIRMDKQENAGRGRVSRVLVFVAGALVVAVGCRRKTAEPGEVARPIKTIVVGEDTSADTFEFPGQIASADRADLSFEVPGRIIEFPVDEGTTVTEGQLVARLDPRDFETRLANADSALVEARAQLKAMKQGRPEDIASAKEKLAAAQAKFRDAQTQLQRQQSLFKAGVISKSELDRAQTIKDVTEADVNAAQQELKRVEEGARPEDIEAQKARIEGLEQQRKEAADALGDTSLKAPFSGVISRKLVDNFTNVQSKQAVASIYNPNQYEIVINIPERFLARGERGGDVNKRIDLQVELVSFPGVPFKARVKEISTTADPVTRTFKTTLSIDTDIPSTDTRKRPQILPGMTAKVIAKRIAKTADSEEVSIPGKAAAGDNQGGFYVWVLDPSSMRVRRAAVELRKEEGLSGEVAWVTRGLSPGDEIAISGIHQLREGMKVRRLGD